MPRSVMISPSWRWVGPGLFFAFTVFLLYGNTLHAPFAFDDLTAIRDNPHVHAHNLRQLAAVLVDGAIDRHVGMFSFALNFYLSDVDTFGYHLTNLLIHIANGLLVFWLVAQTLRLRSPAPERPAQPIPAAENDWAIAFFAALLWLVHPVQTQAVTYIVQRLASLAAFFLLVSFACYVKGRRRADHRRWWWYGASIAAGMLAMGVKQNAAVLPVLIVAFELNFFARSPRQGLRTQWLLAALLVAFLAIMTLVYLGPHAWAVLQARFAGRDFTMGERLLTSGRVIAHYVTLLAAPLPSRLNLDYDFPFSTSLWHPASTLICLVLVLAALAFTLASAPRCPHLSFVLFWFLANLAIESTIVPVDLVQEHRLYLPSIGLIAAAVALVFRLLSTRNRAAAPLVLGLVAVTWSLWTHQRNAVWADPVALWSDTARKSPGKARVHGNLGKVLADAGRYEDAAAEFETALRLDPRQYGAYNNLAVIYIDQLHRYDRAETLLRAALLLYPDFPVAYLNLGVIALRQQRFGDASQAFEKVLALEPTNRIAYYNLAGSYGNQRQFDKALAIVDQGLGYWPRAAELYARKGELYLATGNDAPARQALDTAIKLAPEDPEVRSAYERLASDRGQRDK